MRIDYLAASEKYRPEVIKTLLIGEAPPPNGRTYFYVPASLSGARPIRENRSLPATIFCHYFRDLPGNEIDYTEFLLKLKAMGVFLVDIIDEAIQVRNSKEGVQRVKEAIPRLRQKMKRRKIHVPDQDIVFLLARNNYRSDRRKEFPEASVTRWIDFRMANVEE